MNDLQAPRFKAAEPVAAPPPQRSPRQRWRLGWTGLAAVVMAGVVWATWLLFRWVGERHWLVTAALYLPRAPLVGLWLVLLLVAAVRRRWLGVVWAIPAILPLYWLMPVRPGWGRTSESAISQPVVRVLSWNVDSNRGTPEAIAQQVLAQSPDLVVFVEVGNGGAFRPLFPGFDVRVIGQFVVASRRPIVSVFEPPPVIADGVSHGPRYLDIMAETPIGLVRLLAVHPISPRFALWAARRAFSRKHDVSFGQARASLMGNAHHRQAQVASISAALERDVTVPTIVAGDTNLPDASWMFEQSGLGGLRDSFLEAGVGFGYSFPSKLPWMRIDRILFTDELGCLRHEVGPTVGPDHLPLLAILTRRRG